MAGFEEGILHNLPTAENIPDDEFATRISQQLQGNLPRKDQGLYPIIDKEDVFKQDLVKFEEKHDLNLKTMKVDTTLFHFFRILCVSCRTHFDPIVDSGFVCEARADGYPRDLGE